MTTIKTLVAVALVAISPSIASAQNAPDGTIAYAATVVAITDNSITVKNDQGEDKTFAITSSTKFIDATGVADIQIGQLVGIRIDADQQNAIVIRGKWPPE